ncbi:NADH kinase pos5 [Ceratobasidium sp. 370]|nr:NADH kinase pos5 [Ceratobasidium sp. 370]
MAVDYISKRFEHVTMFVEASSSKPPDIVEPYEPRKPDKPEIDLIITLGGDGTILHASSLFNTGPVPPVLSFSMGTLGFLLPFHINSLPTALDDVFSGTATVLPRMRLACTFYDERGKLIHDETGTAPLQVMNEISPKSRAPAEVSMDGQTIQNLYVGQSVQIAASAYPMPCINRSSPACAPDADEDDGFRSGASQDNWVRDINNLLQFNASFRNSAIVFGKEVR